MNSPDKSIEHSSRICVVEGCSTTTLTEPKKEIFNFPLEADRYSIFLVFQNPVLSIIPILCKFMSFLICRYSDWLLACNRHDLLGRIPRSLNLECGVCSDHFPDSCFVNGSLKRRLRKNAVPVFDEQQSNFTILGDYQFCALIRTFFAKKRNAWN